MILSNRWVAAGSTATLLTGGLFLGVPMASAAPGDAACLDASVQFEAALNAAGIDVTFVNQFEAATEAVVVAAETFEAVTQAALTSEAGLAAEARLTELEAESAKAEEAVVATTTALAEAEKAVLAADPAADPDQDPTVIAAQQALLRAQDALDIVAEAYSVATEAYNVATYTREVQEAELALDRAFANADALALQINDDEAVATELLALFEAFLTACDESAIGVDPATPVVVVPVAPAPVAPVAGTGTTVTAPTGTNKGLNVQTAAETEDNSAAVALLGALLAVGVAVPVATAARMRQLERAQR